MKLGIPQTVSRRQEELKDAGDKDNEEELTALARMTGDRMTGKLTSENNVRGGIVATLYNTYQ